MYLKNPIFSVIEILLSPIFFFWLLCQSRRGSSDTASDPIPPNIFQTWKSEDDMTEKQKASQKSWRDKNPGWCYSLYDDADCEECDEEGSENEEESDLVASTFEYVISSDARK